MNTNKDINNLQSHKLVLGVFLASPKFFILVGAVLVFALSYWFSTTNIILNLLNFLIILEIVRTIWDYVVKDGHIIKIRFILDGAILFCIRELFVGLTMMKVDIVLSGFITCLSLLTIGALVFYRHKIVLHFNKEAERT